MSHSNLLGKSFELGTQDCYTVVRDFYQQMFQIDLPNYARPKQFWKEGMNLYMDRFHRHNFRVLDVHPSEYQYGDLVIMSVQSRVGNHAGVLVENGQLLHHFTGRLSEVTPYRGIWRNSTIAVLRHQDVVIDKAEIRYELSARKGLAQAL